nr:MAG TPA: hypothetical protein [Caudoviricetes sp.]
MWSANNRRLRCKNNPLGRGVRDYGKSGKLKRSRYALK